MVRVPIHDLKARLSHFLRLVQNGETVIIMKRNIPIGEITSPKPQGKRELGQARKRYPDWKPDVSALLEPMSKEEIKLWEEGPIFPKQ
jgi:prevent-host-death family protein